MPCPVIPDVLRGSRVLRHRSTEHGPWGSVDVKNYPEVQGLKVVDRLGGFGKRHGVEFEGPVTHVPPCRAVPSAQVNQGIAGQALLAESLGDGDRLVRASQSAVRLHVAEHPLRWHDRPPGQPDILHEGLGRLTKGNDENFQRFLADRFLPRDEPPLRSAEVELSPWPMDEQRPTVGTDKERDENRSSMGRQQGRDLAVYQAVPCTPAVELLAAFA